MSPPYVAPDGNDKNAGTRAAPWRTVGHAATQAFAQQAKNVSCKVVIRKGVYRETVGDFRDTIKNTAAVIFQGEAPGDVFIDGSDPLGAWTQDVARWFASWPHDWGQQRWRFGGVLPHQEAKFYGKPVPEILRRKEVLFWGDTLLRQVLSPSELKPGTFHVNEAADRVYVEPPPGQTMRENAPVTAAMRSVLWRVQRRNNLVFSNLTFRRDNSYYSSSLSPLKIERCDNVLIERCRFVQNNDTGFLLGWRCADVTLRNCDFSDNGEVGLQPETVTNLLVEDCRLERNNWRGPWGGYTTWSPTGFKLMRSRRATFRRNLARGNHSVGMWVDADNADIRLEDNVCVDNLEEGFYIEYSQGPTLLLRNIARRNQKDGYKLDVATHVTLEKNIAWDNHGYAFFVRDKVRRGSQKIRDTDQTLVLSVDHITLKNNCFVGAKNVLQTLPFSFNNGGFTTTFRSEQNAFYTPDNPQPFAIGTARYDLAGWRRASGQDKNSLWTTPGFAAPNKGDFRLQPDSPLAGWGLPTTESHPDPRRP